MHALDAATGALRWRYQTGGSILFSAAYQDNTVYFASNDMHAYALNATTGALIWQSAKLGSGGFYSYWPVIYNRPGTSESYVIFVGSTHYYHNSAYQTDTWNDLGTGLYLHGEIGQILSPLPGRSLNVVSGGLDASPILENRENLPWRRTYFILNRATGAEFTMDVDADGQPEYAPITFQGAKGGMRYPPVVGGDGRLYQSMAYRYLDPNNPGIPHGQIVSWEPGSRVISPIASGLNAADEPLSYSAGGNMIYRSLTVDRFGGGTLLNSTQDWDYWSYNLGSLIPGYSAGYCGREPPPSTGDYAATFDNTTSGACNYTGIYSQHGVINPLIPYKGRLYVMRGNSIIALSASSGSASQLPMLSTVNVQSPNSQMTTNRLRQKLEEQVQKMLSAGHLLPGYQIAGTWNEFTSPRDCINSPTPGCIGDT
jgi:hypothetical protein